MKEKWLRTMAVFEEYERRFALARTQRIAGRPWEAEGRKALLASVKRLIRFEDAHVPRIRGMEELARRDHGSYSTIACRYETWKDMYGAATLYLPHKNGKLPLVFVCCGHGDRGRHTESYRNMGHRLASLGIAALVMDNIGQGDRCAAEKPAQSPDHWKAVAPFACGLTLQGLIVAETLGLIRYLQTDARFDPARFAACGNSGGGTLTMFLAALAPELCAIASCGYASETGYVMQKERRHCACNLLVGQAWEAEMWEIYSLFAPKPLLLENGRQDDLFPADLFARNARKVRNTYVQLDAPENFAYALTATKHSWEQEDIRLVSGFLAQQLLGVTPQDQGMPCPEEDISGLRVPIPENCLTTAQLSQRLSGKTPPAEQELWEVFPPTFEGLPIDFDQLQTDVGRGNVMRVFAQFECALQQAQDPELKGESRNG